MSKRDQIVLEVDLITAEARSNIEELNKSLKETSKLINSMSGEATTGEGIDRVLLEIQDNLRKASSARVKMLEDIERKDAVNRDKKPIKRDTLDRSAKVMKAQFEKIVHNFATQVDEMAKRSAQQTRMSTPRSEVVGGPTTRLKLPGKPTAEGPVFPEEAKIDIRQSQRDRQKVTSRVTSSVAAMERGAETGSMTYNQAETLKGNMREVFYTASGATPEDHEDVVKYAKGKGGITWDIDDSSPLGRAQSRMSESGNRMQELQDQLFGLRSTIKEGSQGHTPEAFNELLLAEDKVLEELKDQQKLREENRKLLTEIVDGIRRVNDSYEGFKDRTAEEPVTVGPERGSPEDAIASRANAIALSAITAAIFSVKKTIEQGKAVVEGERSSSMAIGLNTGNYDFRSIRRQNRKSGKEFGFTGSEMLDYSEQVMGTMGYTDQTSGVARELARSERLSGTDEGTMSGLYDTLLRSGAISTADEARDLTNQITGGIISSGMVGRQEEQVTAMQQLLDEQTSGRTASNEEIKNQLAINSMLSEFGGKSLQGENLHTNISSVNQAIADMGLYDDMAMFMGIGSDPDFAGPGGAFRFREETEKGLGSEKVLDGIRNMVETMGTEDAKSMMSQSNIFSSMSTDAIASVVDMAEKGQLTIENAQKYDTVNTRKGEEDMDRREEGFLGSSDYDTLLSEVLKETIASNLDDSIVGDITRKPKNVLDSVGASSPLASLVHTLGKGALSGASAAGGGYAALKYLAPSLKGLGSSPLGDLMGGAGSKAVSAGMGTRLFSGAKDMATRGVTTLGAMDPSAIATVTDKSILAGTAAKALGGVYKVSQAENKKAELASQTGNVAGFAAGAKGGAMAGGVLGAKVGTFFGGPLGTAAGTAIGTLGGSLVGGIGGSKMGQSIGDWFSGKFLGGTDRQNAEGVETSSGFIRRAGASSMGESLSVADKQGDVALTTAKASIEGDRRDNIDRETGNLSAWDRLLSDIRTILQTAKQQNGIIGDPSAAGNAVSGGGVGVSGDLGTVSKGSYWTNNNQKFHDIGKTVSELTSDELDSWIADKAKPGSSMLGMGSAFMEAGNQSGLDPRYLVAHAALETGWGQSGINKDKHNFFGIGAFDNSPYESAYDWSDPKEGIVGGAQWIADNYYGKGHTNVSSMHGAGYATDPKWADKLASTMAGSESYTSKSKGDVNITTNVNMNAGSSRADGVRVGRAVTNEIDKVFSNEYYMM